MCLFSQEMEEARALFASMMASSLPLSMFVSLLLLLLFALLLLLLLWTRQYTAVIAMTTQSKISSHFINLDIWPNWWECWSNEWWSTNRGEAGSTFVYPCYTCFYNFLQSWGDDYIDDDLRTGAKRAVHFFTHFILIFTHFFIPVFTHFYSAEMMIKLMMIHQQTGSKRTVHWSASVPCNRWELLWSLW